MGKKMEIFYYYMDSHFKKKICCSCRPQTFPKQHFSVEISPFLNHIQYLKINPSPAENMLSSCLLCPGCTAVSCKPCTILGSEVSSIFVSTMELCHPSVNLAVRRVHKTQMLLPGLLCSVSVTWPINGKMFTFCHFSQSCR